MISNENLQSKIISHFKTLKKTLKHFKNVKKDIQNSGFDYYEIEWIYH